MGNKQAQRRTSARRAATFLAALGALVMSSGVALMVAATPAHAAVNECVPQEAYTQTSGWVDESPGEGWYQVDSQVKTPATAAHWTNLVWHNYTSQQPESAPALDDSNWHALPAKPAAEGHSVPPRVPNVPYNISNGESGNGSWFLVTGDWVEATAAVYEYKFAFDHPAVTCDVEKQLLTPQEPTFVPATCTSGATITLPQQATEESYRMAVDPTISSSDVDGVHYVATGSLAPGGTVNVDATLIDPKTTDFVEGATTHWSYPVTAPSGCTEVSPPVVESEVVVSPPKAKTPKAHAAAVTPTVVEAGLLGTSAQDLRGEQGLALMVAGMVMLVGAGGLGLRVRSAAARS